MNRNKKSKRKYKYSVRLVITFTFVSILILSFAAYFLINSFFLEDFYINKKESTLMDVFSEIDDASVEDTLMSEEFDIKLQKISSKYNTSIIIISSLFEPIKVYSNEQTDRLLRELRYNINGWLIANDVIVETDDYIMVRKSDSYVDTEYIEIWGNLSGGGFVMLKTAIESIQESTAISNTFMFYVGGCAIFVFGIFIFLFTRKISKPIIDMAEISSRMANFDFDARYEGNSNTEVGLLGRNINALSETLEQKISELKEANVKLLGDIKKLEQSEKMQSEFLSDVSHELKTPIALIQGYAEGLMEGVNEEEERDYYCDVIIDEAGKMNHLVKQLLSLNQLEFGNGNLSIDRFDIVSLIGNYIQSAEILTKQDDIVVNINATGPVYVWADEFMIEEVFTNLFSNAINHCESDIQKEIDVSVVKSDNIVVVKVFNTGKNIPEDVLPYIWDKFYKVDKARTREYGGSGVGLSIVKAIVESHGQSCSVENKENGVEFLFTLDGKQN